MVLKIKVATQFFCVASYGVYFYLFFPKNTGFR